VVVEAAFRLPFCLDGNWTISTGLPISDAWLDKYGRAAWREEIRLIFGHHH
jgi:hypothetical protein